MGQGDVLEYLKAHGPATSRQIADALELNKDSITQSLRILIKDGYVIKTGKHRGGTQYDPDPPVYSYHDRTAAKEEPKKGRGGRKPAITLSKEELEAAFADAGSAKALAERLGCSTQTAITCLDRYGIERRTYGKARAEKPPEPPQEAQEEERVEVPDEPETPQIEAEEEPEQYVPDSNIPTVCEPLVPAEEMSYPERWTNAVDGPQAPPGDALANAVTILADRLADLVDIMARQERTITVAENEAQSADLLKGLTSGEPVKAVEMPDMATVECREMPESVQDMTIPSYDDLAHLSYGLMLSVHEIGRQYGVLGSTVRRWMLYRGLPMWTDEEEGERQKLKKRMGKKTSPETQAKALRDYQEFWNRQRAEYGYEAEAAV